MFFHMLVGILLLTPWQAEAAATECPAYMSGYQVFLLEAGTWYLKFGPTNFSTVGFTIEDIEL